MNNITDELTGYKDELKKIVEANAKAVKDKLEESRREAKNTAEELSKPQDKKYEVLENNMSKILREGLVSISNNLNEEKQSNTPRVKTDHRYLEAARRPPQIHRCGQR